MKRDGLMRVFETLLEAYGEQGWWPGSSPLEIIVGAILTQRTTWENASRGIERLADSGLLSIEGLTRASEETVAAAVRPSGCFRSKARKLKAFAARVEDRYGGDLDRLLDLPTPALRQELLDIYGIGPETADAVLLYAASRPAFVVDAYARRLLERLGVLRGEERYDEVQQVLTEAFPEDVSLFGEFHALIVRHGKARCRSRPSCGDCPLAAECCYVVREERGSPWKCASIVDA